MGVDWDGVAGGVNFESQTDAANTSNAPVVVSGGVSSVFDVMELKERFASRILYARVVSQD